MTDYPIEKSSEIFFEIAQKYGEDPITDHDQIMSLLADLDQQLGGLVFRAVNSMTYYRLNSALPSRPMS
jgi:hypothetical protein